MSEPTQKRPRLAARFRAVDTTQTDESKEATLAAFLAAHPALEDLAARDIVRCMACSINFSRSHHVSLDCAGLTAHVECEGHLRRLKSSKGQSSLLQFYSRTTDDVALRPRLRTPPSSSDHA